jgi:predicted metal-binding membrane protein
MLPSLVPMLWRYCQAVGRAGAARLGPLTALVGVGYFVVWAVLGMAVFPLGVARAAVEMEQPGSADGSTVRSRIPIVDEDSGRRW